ncbi:hypothetical protein CBR_g40852 [Chara braunii]|uniref:Integrase zinc-binding domain-containing protein n=1 Tax=Chara braunii TaxID=69332 RepID=A0A388K2H2_CHABU|nr:hypothetical protein CBR_g40852 [Chara braunii]|eukprot:GBG64153.1 hypothetical protein CBR_g40852 [Chara braunii]
MADGGRKLLTIDDLVEALDKRERAPSNVPKVDTFHFKGERVFDWLDLTEQALVGLSDEVKLQRVLRYVLRSHHQGVAKVVDAANGSWARFRDMMQRKYRLGDGLLTTADLEAMNKDDFSMIGAFVHEFKRRARKLTGHGGGSKKLTWATIDKGVEEGNLDQVEQHQMRLQRRKRKERDATAFGTPGVKRIVTDVLAALGYDNEAKVQRRGVTVAQGRASGAVEEEARREDYGGEETGSQILTKAQRKQRNLQVGGQGSGKGMWQEKEELAIKVEEIVGDSEEVTQRLKAGTIREEPIVVESDDEGQEGKGEPAILLLGRMEDLLQKVGRYQRKLQVLCEEAREWEANLPEVFLYDSGPEPSPEQQGYPKVATVGAGPRSGGGGGVGVSASGREGRPCDGPGPSDKSAFFRGGLKQGSQRRYKTIDKKCRPVPVLVTEDEEAYYERERGLIRRMREHALAGPCRINDENEGKLIIGKPDFLSPQERALMVGLMKKRHCAYAFNDDERGRLDVDKIPMIRIHTVPHEPWNLRGMRYPNPDEEKKAVDYLDGKMRTQVADYSSGPYASPWFCFIKPNGTLRWVQDLQRLNAETVRDAGGLPNADALSESCAGRPIISLIDLDSGYDQFPVYPPDRPVTAMHTPRGLIHMNVVPQGWTNAVTMVQRHMIRAMQTVSPHITQPYIDDLAVKDPKEKEEDEAMPGVRRFVWKHVQDIDQVLGLLKENNLTASGPKSKHCMREAMILGCVSHPIWLTRKGYEQKEELVLKHFQEEDSWGSKDVGWMMKLALAGTHSLVEEVRTIEEGPTQVEEHQQLMGGMYLLTNMLLQGDFDWKGSFSHEEDEILIPESRDDEFEEGEIKETFRAEEYDGIYRELGLLLSCEMRDRDASAKAQKMRHLYVVRDGHLFIKRQVGNPRRIVCGRNRQIDIIAALHDGIVGGQRGVSATCAKISELYHWDGMLTMVIKYCRSCIPCQERSAQRSGEPLHPMLEREVGAVVYLDLLFMPAGENGCNYIFDARDNLTGFVDGRAIRTKTDPVLANCIEEYYLRYPFVREFVMDRGSEFTCNEVRTLLAGSDFPKTAMQRGGRGARPRQGPQGASGGDDSCRPLGRESTPIFDDGNIELFFDSYQAHATRDGWSTLERIRHLRGVGRFEEPIAHIREETLTWQDVEARMQMLRASPMGPDGLPIRLEEGNAEEFISAYEQYMRDQGTGQEEWMQMLPLWTRRSERSLARQIQDRAHGWVDCQAQPRQAFRRLEPERPEPRVERRQRTKRSRGPEARGTTTTRGGRKALAQREGPAEAAQAVEPVQAAGPAQAVELPPTYGLEQVEFRRITGSDLQGPSPTLPEGGETVPLRTPLDRFEAHLDASQWGVSQRGADQSGPARYEPMEDEPEEEPPEPGSEAGSREPEERQTEGVITVGDDTPPTPIPEQARQYWPEGIPEPDSEEMLGPPP